jgi:hypothetical protein
MIPLRIIAPRWRWFFAAMTLSVITARSEDLPWVSITPEHDGRDAEMAAFDVRDIEEMIGVLNNSEPFKLDQFTFACVPISKLLRALTPFAELHFDPINPVPFTPEEKTILKEWLKRGGFIAAFEDTYPYAQEDFRKKRDIPVVNFFTKDLPAEDPDFTVSKAPVDSPFFRQGPFPTDPAPSLQVEMEDNPNFYGYTTVSYRGRVVIFFLGRYSAMDDRRWIPYDRPFPEAHALTLQSYYLTLNIYYYALMH